MRSSGVSVEDRFLKTSVLRESDSSGLAAAVAACWVQLSLYCKNMGRAYITLSELPGGLEADA